MYLSHKELEAISSNIFTTVDEDPSPFSPDDQIRVCSVDIRVSNGFWIMKKQRALFRKKRRVIDLSFTATFELSPTRLWERKTIQPNGYIDLKPGEMVLGRTHELIKMPKDIVGKINTRSSYARMGLSTACNCDLINPGYQGHVPLELVNNTNNVIRIRPFLPLCQVFLMKVDGEITDSYSSDKFASKYNFDEGGPSVWWRDSLVKKVQNNITFSQVGEFSVEKLRDKFEKIDDDGLQRFDKLLNKKQHSDAETFINDFTDSESTKQKFYKMRRSTSRWAFPALVVVSIVHLLNAIDTSKGISFTPNVTAYGLWTLALISFFPFIYYVFSKERKFYAEV